MTSVRIITNSIVEDLANKLAEIERGCSGFRLAYGGGGRGDVGIVLESTSVQTVRGVFEAWPAGSVLVVPSGALDSVSGCTKVLEVQALAPSTLLPSEIPLLTGKRPLKTCVGGVGLLRDGGYGDCVEKVWECATSLMSEWTAFTRSLSRKLGWTLIAHHGDIPSEVTIWDDTGRVTMQFSLLESMMIGTPAGYTVRSKRPSPPHVTPKSAAVFKYVLLA